jgi:hypothetical protein
VIERTKRTKALLAVLAVVALVASLTAAAIAQDDGSGGQAAAPQDTSNNADVPKGPYVDFCPTLEQTEAHLKLYGFDYKPTVACTAEGKVAPSSSPVPADPEDALSDEEACKKEKADLLDAQPLPDDDGDPTTLRGKHPDGGEFIMGVMASEAYAQKLQGMDIHDFARSELGC